MIILSNVSTGAYGPFFLDGGTLIFAGEGSSTVASNGVTGTISDENGVSYDLQFGIAGGTGAFSGTATRSAPPGDWTFTVESGVTGLNLTVRHIPE